MSARSRATARVLAGLGPVCAVAMLAGCQLSRSSTPGSLNPITQPSVVEPTSSSARPDNPGSPSAPVTTHPATPPAPASVPECKKADVTVAIDSEDSGLGHRRVVLVFANHGSRKCSIHGYPGVAALDSGGKQVAQAVRTIAGYMGGLQNADHPPKVLLSPGDSASAVVEALAYNAKDGSACTGYHGLLVTVPDDVVSTRLAWNTDACSEIEVHPVVAGTSGIA
jgi:hypothetical protein